MTKSWSVSYSCRVQGCRWVTSKKKALLCISPSLLSVVLPSDATSSTTRLLESIKLSREGGKPVMQVVKASMHCKARQSPNERVVPGLQLTLVALQQVSEAREFLLRFNTPTEVNECQRLMTDLGAFEWHRGRGLHSQGPVLDVPTDTQLPSSQMDVEEEEMAPASPQQRVGLAPAASTNSFPPGPSMVDPAYSAARSSSSTSSSAPATSFALTGPTFSSAPVLSSTAATTPAATSAGFGNFGATSASVAVATDVAQDIEITEGNFEFYLSMCLNDPRFPMIVEQVEKAWVRHMGLGGTAAESLERLMK